MFELVDKTESGIVLRLIFVEKSSFCDLLELAMAWAIPMYKVKQTNF